MLLYRVTFSGPNDSHVHCDVEAEDSDQAFRFAYAKLQNRDRYTDRYTDATVEEITKGPKPIGIKFESYDHYAKKSYTDYMVILAEDEKQAIDYYNRKYRGKHYWFNAGRPEPDGKNEYRQVKETYFAACPGYDADATKESV